MFFAEQTLDALAGAIRQFLQAEDKFRPDVLQKNASCFSQERFKEQAKNFVEEKWQQFEKEKSFK